jgi:hypothetical protein
MLLSSREPEVIAAALRELLTGDVRAQHAAAATRLLPRNHALSAAEEILSLVVDRDRVEDATLLVEPGTLFAAEQDGIPERDLLQVAALILAKTIANRDAGYAETSVDAAGNLLRHLRDHGAATRHAVSAVKKSERCATPEEVAAGAIRIWEEGKQL